jgi:hypothetical protein
MIEESTSRKHASGYSSLQRQRHLGMIAEYTIRKLRCREFLVFKVLRCQQPDQGVAEEVLILAVVETNVIFCK